MAIEMGEDEADKKRRDPSRPYDPFEVRNKQKGFGYRLLNKNSRNLERKLYEGYEIVQGNDPEQLGLSDSTPLKKGADVDTTRRFNDTVLARIPEEKLEEKRKANRERINRMNAMTRSQFKQDTGDAAFEGGGGGGWSGSMSETEFNETKGKE